MESSDPFKAERIEANKMCEAYMKVLNRVATDFEQDPNNPAKREILQNSIRACINFGGFGKKDPNKFANRADELRAKARELQAVLDSTLENK